MLNLAEKHIVRETRLDNSTVHAGEVMRVAQVNVGPDEVGRINSPRDVRNTLSSLAKDGIGVKQQSRRVDRPTEKEVAFETAIAECASRRFALLVGTQVEDLESIWSWHFKIIHPAKP
jgi:hypothetical protein